MFGSIKKMFVVVMELFGCNVLNANPLKCVSMNNQEYKVRSEIININGNETLFHRYSVKMQG